MIEIDFVKDNNIKKISIKGHANSSKYGSDLVCCAVSVLSQSIINGMIKALDYRKDFFLINQDGNIEINIPSDISEKQELKIQTLADTLYINLKDLTGQYSKYMIFREKGV